MPSVIITNYKWIENPEQSNWNIQDINFLINQIKNGNLHGGYGKDVSNEMKDIMQAHMIDNVSFFFLHSSPWQWTGEKKSTSMKYIFV
jgi:hypothetical protein